MEANLSHKLPLKGAPEVAECSNAWLLYLQSLASVCAAGARVSASLQVLANGPQVTGATGNCRAAWEELSRASQAAGHSVRTEVLSGLRELGSEDQLRNDQIIQSSLATLINFQYQFCVACVECFGNISNQEHNHQIVSPSPSSDLGRQQLFSRILGGQRRWSEVARRPPAEREEDCEDNGIGRRWSVPWESTSAVVSGHHHLTVPGQERSSRSTTPDTSSSLASQEELHDVISLLSLKPTNSLQQNARHLPGVTFTSCGSGDGKEGWPSVACSRESPNVNWSQSSLSESGEGTHQSLCQIRVNTSPRQSHLHRPRTGWTPQESLYSTIWGEQDGENPNRPAERTEPFVQNETNGGLYHRKSSSSTDSSSSSSIPHHQLNHQMALQGTSPLYSMWSGNDMPLIQLPSGSSAGQSSSLDPSQQPPNARPD